MLDLIHLTGMEKSMKNQYQNATNISTRINLHSLYSTNKQGWFPWIYEQSAIRPNQKILELGCGDGSLWKQNMSLVPKNVHITLSDISEGMLRDTRRSLGAEDDRFTFEVIDCHSIPFEAQTFDLIIANHVLFYCQNIPAVCREIRRVLKPDGRFLCSTYSSLHMKEVSGLVQEFDERIVLAAENLYEIFGRENGSDLLKSSFSHIQWISYPDSLLIPDVEPLISYILSCHGNQNQYLPDRYKEFRSFVKSKIGNGFHITKDAGIFLAQP